MFKNALYEKTGGLKPSDPEYKVMQQMVDMWTNFAEKGDPNCDVIAPVTWKSLDTSELPMKCLNISITDVSFIDYPETERMKLWDEGYKVAECLGKL